MTTTQEPTSKKHVKFTTYQKFIVIALALLQFTLILDFMIMSPLGAIMMPALDISAKQFGLVVSIYAFSAGISGILSAGYADRYDRKKFLLFFYTGFIIGTLLCGLANTYEMLLIARMITGIFGGVIGSIVMAITTDLFSFEVRGRVMGAIQTAFAASQVLGIPAGLYISNHYGWHAPFIFLVLFSLILMIAIWYFVKPIDTHISKKTDQNAFHHLKKTITIPKYISAFLATALLSLGGFMMMPFGSAYTVHNLGVSLEQLPNVYLITGIASIFIGPFVGRASDYFGKYNTFLFGTVLTMIMVYIYTHMGISPFYLVALVNTVMFIGIFSRMIPSQTLMSAIPSPEYRGSFMAIGSSLQQISGGIGAAIAGLIVVVLPDGSVEHFDRIGYVLMATSLITAYQIYKIHLNIKEKKD